MVGSLAVVRLQRDLHADMAAACQKGLLGRSAAGGAFREQMSLPRSPFLAVPNAKLYPSLTMLSDQERSIISPEGRLTWTRTWKIAFAHMAAYTAKPSSIGLRPNGKCWRHRRPSWPANQIRRRSHGRPHVRRPPPERSRGPADAADHIRDASPCSAGKLVEENTARSFGFELQGSCPTFASWCASKRDP
jgi:hypothetical protein